MEDSIAAAVAAGAALNVANEDIAARKLEVKRLQKLVRQARAVTDKYKVQLGTANSAIKRTKELLDRANERLVQAGCEEVTAKVAPGTGSPNGVTEGASGGSGTTSPGHELFGASQDSRGLQESQE